VGGAFCGPIRNSQSCRAGRGAVRPGTRIRSLGFP
jgi:hypothetical protein